MNRDRLDVKRPSVCLSVRRKLQKLAHCQRRARDIRFVIAGRCWEQCGIAVGTSKLLYRGCQLLLVCGKVAFCSFCGFLAFFSASEATATWRFTNFVLYLYCIVYLLARSG